MGASDAWDTIDYILNEESMNEEIDMPHIIIKSK